MTASLQQLLAVSALLAVCDRLLRCGTITEQEAAELRALISRVHQVFREPEHV